MKISLLYGLLMTVGSAVLILVLFFLGLHNAPEKASLAGMIGNLGGLAIAWAVLCLGISAARTQAAQTGRDWTYGWAFAHGVGIAFFGAVFGSIFSYLYFTAINPNFLPVLHDAQVMAMEARGLSPERIEQAEGMMNKMMTPGVLTFFGFVIGLVNGLLLSVHFALAMIRRYTRGTLLRYYALIGLPIGFIIGVLQGMQHGHLLLGAGLGLVLGPIVEVIIAAIALAFTHYKPQQEAARGS